VASSPLLENVAALESACLSNGVEGVQTEAVLKGCYLGRLPDPTPTALKAALEAKAAELRQSGQTWEQLFRDAAKRGRVP
jgi:hypothetical protein